MNKEQQEGCPHTAQRTREGQTGAWCDKCGVKVLEYHTQPCKLCSHFEPSKSRPSMGYCNVLQSYEYEGLHVCYWLEPGPGRRGLCFEPRPE